MDIDYIIQQDGVTVISPRFKQQKFVPFDIQDAGEFGSKSTCRIKTRNKTFTLPMSHLEVATVEQIPIPSSLVDDIHPPINPSNDVITDNNQENLVVS